MSIIFWPFQIIASVVYAIVFVFLLPVRFFVGLSFGLVGLIGGILALVFSLVVLIVTGLIPGIFVLLVILGLLALLRR